MKKKGPVIILGALDGEISALLENFKILGKQSWKGFYFYPGKIEGIDVVIAKSGVGKVLTAMITQKLIDLFYPSAIIFTGIAGSLKDSLKIGDILIGKDSVQHDVDATAFKFKRGEIPYTAYRFFQSDEKLYDLALSYRDEAHQTISGRVLTGDQFISSQKSDSKSYLTDELQGDCVEMEGASMAMVCTVNHIPHLIIRTISDRVGHNEKVNLNKILKITSINTLNIVTHILKNI